MPRPTPPRPPLELVNLARAYVALPTASFKEARVYGFLRTFAAEHGLDYREDALGNAVIEYRRGRRTTPLVLGTHTDHPAFVVTAVHGRRVTLEFRGGVPANYGRGERVRIVAGEPGEDRGDGGDHLDRGGAGAAGRPRTVARREGAAGAGLRGPPG